MVLNILRDLEGQELPEFVKIASVDDLDPSKLSGLPDGAFADGNKRQYPVHTKAATYTSAVRYLRDSVYDGKGNEQTTAQLLKFASVWGIEPEVRQVADKLAAEVEPYIGDIPDSSFMLIYTDDKGNKCRRYLAIDAETTKTAAVDFYKERHLYPFAQRYEITTRLHEKIATFKPAMSRSDGTMAKAYIDAMMANSDCSGFDAAAAVDARRQFISDFELCKNLEKTAKELYSSERLSAKHARELIELLDTVDMTQGLHTMYGKRGLKLPEDDIYANVRLEVDNPHTRVKLANGAEFDVANFDKVGSTPFQVVPEHLDSVFVDGVFNVDAAVKVASELSSADAQLFGRAMAEAIASGMTGDKTRPLDRTVEEDDVPLAGLRA